MNGPAFSTRAEANVHRMIGADIIGMTNAPEARLCREAEIAAAALALVTDYDCWKDRRSRRRGAHRRRESPRQQRARQADRPRRVALIPETPDSPCHRVLDTAIFTARATWPEQTARDLAPILGRFG